jgi:hypothetical protein
LPVVPTSRKKFAKPSKQPYVSVIISNAVRIHDVYTLIHQLRPLANLPAIKHIQPITMG